MRAFIFSLDAFVAFTLALVAIYSLIFFSSIPSAYYYLLTQGHYLSRDALLALSTTPCSDVYGVCKTPGSSLLDNIVAQDNRDYKRELVKSNVGGMVPRQFGYTFEISGDEGQTWDTVYSTSSPFSEDPHANLSKKLNVTTQVMTFGYSGRVNKLATSPYRYRTCTGEGMLSDGGTGAGNEDLIDFGIITCGEFTIESGTGTNTTVIRGNTNPGNMMGGDIVPQSNVNVVRLTIFI